MINYFGVIQLGLLAGSGFAILASLVSAMLYPLLRQRIAKLSPELRSTTLLAWLIAPALIGAMLSLLSFMPSIISLFAFVPDHCSIHDGHLHLCLIHPPLPVESSILQLLLAALVGISAFFIGTPLVDLLRAHKFHRSLMMASRHHETDPVRVVDWDMPLALSVGFRRMRVFISSQLMQTLSPQQLNVVIAHEQAHVSRRDPLRHFIAHAFSFVHIPWLRKALLNDFELATEQACDEVAARKVGDRLQVADTIISVERMFSRQQLPFTVLSIGGSNICQRVESLLLEPVVYVPVHRAHILIAATLLFLPITLVNELHHQTESILGFLVR